MSPIRGTTCATAVGALMASLLLAACGPGPAPSAESSASLAEGHATLPSASREPGARTVAAAPERLARVPAPVASDVASSGVCPSSTSDAAPLDGGREVTPAPEPDAQGQSGDGLS